jgi:hypothetical protein
MMISRLSRGNQDFLTPKASLPVRLGLPSFGGERSARKAFLAAVI